MGITVRMQVRALVAVAAAIAACGGEPGSGGGPAMVTDSAGVEIVRNDSVGSVGRFRTREVRRLGVLEGGGPESFDGVRAVALDTAGRIYVGNNGTGTVRVFGPDGRFRTELGGRGEGPAEVSMVNDLLVAGGTVVLTDWQRGGKQVLFRPNGELVASWTSTRPAGSRMTAVARTSGGWLSQVGSPELPDLAPGESYQPTRDLYRTDPDADSLGRPLHRLPSTTLYGVPGGEGGVDWGLFRWTWPTGYDGRGRPFVVHPDGYRIDVHAPGGGVVRSVRRAFVPRLITEEDVAEVRERALRVLDTIGGERMTAAMRQRQKESLGRRIDGQARLPLPAIAPPLGDILVSHDGSFWVEHRDTSSPARIEARQMFGGLDRFPETPTEWGLFDPEGVYLGAVELPVRFRPEAVQGRDVVGVWVDELDVEYVLHLQAVPSGAPS